MTVTEKIENIEKTIKRHEYNFYVLGEKTISTPELEVLKVELYNLKNMKMNSTPQTNSNSPTGGNPFKFFDGI